MAKAKLILVGGFLGAGKTTLLSKSADYFIKKGKKVDLITNDQTVDLVDTELLARYGFDVQEVSGGCFCCRFGELIAAAERINDRRQTDVILAEPVGSCTDLSATVLRPLKKLYADNFELAPFSVLADPLRLLEFFKHGGKSLMPDSAFYIYRKQLEESDLIVLNKSDMLTEGQSAEANDLLNREFPQIPVITISALKGESVKKWLELIMSDKIVPGSRLIQVDYDIYAEGEAVLGWLNASFELSSEEGRDWKLFCESFMTLIREKMRSRKAEIAHLKMFIKSGERFLTSNLVSNESVVFINGNLDHSGRQAALLVNARVRMEPLELREIVEQALREAAADNGISFKCNSIASFKPGRPNPTHHFDSLVL